MVRLKGNNPYEKLDNIKEQNPSLFKEIEDDFNRAEDLKINVWRGSKYYFIRSREFVVIPSGKLTYVTIERFPKRRRVRFNLVKFHSNEGTAQISVSLSKMNREKLIETLNPLLTESRITVKLLD